MAQYRRSEIISGLFILLAVSAFTLFAFKVGGLDLFFFLRSETRSFETLLPDVKGLEGGSKVAFGGRRIGKITKISLALPSDVAEFKTRFKEAWGTEFEEPEDSPAQDMAMMMRVVFEVEESEISREDGESFRLHGPTATVVLSQESLLGGHFLQLQPGLPEFWEQARPVFGKGALEFDGALPVRGRSADLMDVVQRELRPTLDRVERLLDKVNDGILSDTNITRIEGALKELELGIASLRTFTDTLPALTNGEPGSIQKELLIPIHELIENTDSTITELRTEIVDRLVKNAEETLKSGTRTLATAEDVLAKAGVTIDAAGPEMVATLANLRSATEGLSGRLDALQARLDSVLKKTDLLVAENRSEVGETLQSMRRAAWELEMLMRKVRANPALLIFGDDEADLSALPVDAAGLRRSGRAKPYGQRDETNEGDR